ncbi:MAG: rRNA maturation RNase YbeY [Gemmatimonadaceae bacterium]
MSLAVAVAADGVRVPLARERVAEIARLVLRAEKVRDAMLSIAFVTPRAIAALNFEHLGHAEPTDVISFGFAPTAGAEGTVGDVYICPEVAGRNARERGARVSEEIARLVVHGTLHVLGYDHPEEGDRTASDMWQRQERLVARAMGATKGAATKRATTRATKGATKGATKTRAARGGAGTRKSTPRRRR